MPGNNRITSYRKLKKKNAELIHDIKMMVRFPETEEGIEIYMKWINILNKDERSRKTT